MRTIALRQSTDLKAGCTGSPYTVVQVHWESNSASGSHSRWPADSPLLRYRTTRILYLKGASLRARPTRRTQPQRRWSVLSGSLFYFAQLLGNRSVLKAIPLLRQEEEKRARALFCQKFEVDRSVLKAIPLLQPSSLAFEGVWN